MDNHIFFPCWKKMKREQLLGRPHDMFVATAEIYNTCPFAPSKTGHSSFSA